MQEVDGLIAPLYARLRARDLLSAEEQAALRAIAGPRRVVPAGADMVTEGSRATKSTLVTDGYAMRYRLLEDGDRQITAIHVAGDFVDLHSFLLKVMDHSVGALSTCTIVTFDHTELEKITRQYPHLTRLLWLSTLLDAAIHREWIVGLGRLSAFARLAHLICELHVRLKIIGAGDDRGFVLPITQIELGDALGISSVHVNRVLQDMREQELVVWKGARIDIIDWQGLSRAAEFDPRYLHLEREPR
jgi:CRP-like cAMP-binding protein